MRLIHGKKGEQAGICKDQGGTAQAEETDYFMPWSI